MSVHQKFIIYIMAPLYLVGFAVETAKAVRDGSWNAYFNNTVVWAVLAAVGLLLLLWLAELVWFLCWRHRQYQRGCPHSTSYRDFVNR